jgi:purine-cytosine permease-like protein
MSPPVVCVCVIKVAFFAEASAVLLPVSSQQPEIHCKTIILFLLLMVKLFDTSELQLFLEVLSYLLLIWQILNVKDYYVGEFIV